MSVECTTLTENNEEFIESTYNGFKIYVRKLDSYINVSRMCADNNRDFRTFKRGERFRNILNYYINEEMKGVQNCTPLYELRKGYNLMQGQWLTPDLIHFVAEWISISYSFKVKHIMDKINELGQLKQIAFEENTKIIINNLNEEIEMLKNKNLKLTKGIKNLNTCKKRRKGCLKIVNTKKNDGFHVYSYEIHKNKYSDNETIIDIYNAIDILHLLNFYAKSNIVKDFSYINYNVFKCLSLEKLIEIINDLANNSLMLDIDYDKIIIDDILRKRRCNVKEYFNLRDYIKNNNSMRGILFEYYCAKKYNLSPFKLTCSESLGFGKKDIGCDLLNIDTSTTAQCKYYKSFTKLKQKNILNYIDFVDDLNYENNYLFINESLKFAEDFNIPDYIEIIRISENEITEFIEYVIKISNEKIKEIKEQEIIEKEQRCDKDDDRETIIEDRHDYKNNFMMDKKIDENVKEQREFVKNIIDSRDISLNEMLKLLEENFNVKYDKYTFGKKFSDLYKHELNSSFPKINGEKHLIKPNVNLLYKEREFIEKFLENSDYRIEEYLEIHNKKFNTNYKNTSEFCAKFNNYFEHDNDSCLARRTINGVREHVFSLKNEGKIDIYIDWIKKFINDRKDLHNRKNEIPLPILLPYLNEHFHIYYTMKFAKKIFKPYFKITESRRLSDDEKKLYINYSLNTPTSSFISMKKEEC